MLGASLTAGVPQQGEARGIALTTTLPGHTGTPLVFVTQIGGHVFSYDATDRANPVMLDDLTGPGALSFLTQCVVSGTHLYVASDTGAIAIFDVSDPAAMSYVGAFTDADLVGAHEVVKHPSADVLYVTAPTGHKVVTVGIASPTSPVKLAALTHAAIVSPEGLAISPDESRLLVCSSNGNLVALSLGTPSTPTYAAHGAMSGGAPGWVAYHESGTRAVTVTNQLVGRLDEWDLAGGAPQHVATLTDARLDRPLAVACRGDLVGVCCQGDIGVFCFVSVAALGSPEFVDAVYQPTPGLFSNPGSGELFHNFRPTMSDDGFVHIAVAGGSFGRYTIIDIGRARALGVLGSANGPRIGT